MSHAYALLRRVVGAGRTPLTYVIVDKLPADDRGHGGSTQAERPAVLLLHGFPDIACSWRATMGPIAAAGYHVIAPDQRGYGATTGWDGPRPPRSPPIAGCRTANSPSVPRPSSGPASRAG